MASQSASASAPANTCLKALAEWTHGLKFEHLSPKAVEFAKLYWFDSLGCAVGGSKQEDAHILLAHHQEMAGGAGSGSGGGVALDAVGVVKQSPW
ncbi:MAG: MmgE/PrpD family protein, partial [Phycisphaerae bacterium]|nr:MmgE/PrpD family protein [Phycisphaerae bacterium]